MIERKVDILVITETKLDAAFLTSQCFAKGFSKPYILDRNRNVSGILIYICEDILR